MIGIAAAIAVLTCFVYPPLGPLAMVLTANLYLWRGRAEIRRQQRAREAKARERAEREFIAAMKSLG